MYSFPSLEEVLWVSSSSQSLADKETIILKASLCLPVSLCCGERKAQSRAMDVSPTSFHYTEEEEDTEKMEKSLAENKYNFQGHVEVFSRFLSLTGLKPALFFLEKADFGSPFYTRIYISGYNLCFSS